MRPPSILSHSGVLKNQKWTRLPQLQRLHTCDWSASRRTNETPYPSRGRDVIKLPGPVPPRDHSQVVDRTFLPRLGIPTQVDRGSATLCVGPRLIYTGVRTLLAGRGRSGGRVSGLVYTLQILTFSVFASSVQRKMLGNCTIDASNDVPSRPWHIPTLIEYRRPPWAMVSTRLRAPSTPNAPCVWLRKAQDQRRRVSLLGLGGRSSFDAVGATMTSPIFVQYSPAVTHKR